MSKVEEAGRQSGIGRLSVGLISPQWLEKENAPSTSS